MDDGELITFDALHSREEIDITDGTIEVSESGLIRRGKIEGIIQYSNHTPEYIIWIDGTIWDDRRRTWIEDDASRNHIVFAYGDIEFYAGPFEMKSGEIFFMIKRFRKYVRIFPRGCEVPDLPRRERMYVRLLAIIPPIGRIR